MSAGHRDLDENHVVRSPEDGWETLICRTSHEYVSYQKRGAFSYCPLCGTSFEEILGGTSVRTDGGPRAADRTTEADHLGGTGRLLITSCDWCGASLPQAGAVREERFDRDGRHLDEHLICADCDRYGPRGTDRRTRVELAWKLRVNQSLLERFGWWLIRRANR